MERRDWRKSSYSDGGGEESDCIEVAFGESAVGVRDSKDPSSEPLTFPAPAWRGFLMRL